MATIKYDFNPSRRTNSDPNLPQNKICFAAGKAIVLYLSFGNSSSFSDKTKITCSKERRARHTAGLISFALVQNHEKRNNFSDYNKRKKWTNTDAQIVFQCKLYYITVFHNNHQFLYLSTSALYVELYDLKRQQNIEAYTVVNFFTVLQPLNI